MSALREAQLVERDLLLYGEAYTLPGKRVHPVRARFLILLYAREKQLCKEDK